MFTHLCTREKRALNTLAQAYRLLIVSVVFSYCCMVLMCLSETIFTNLNKHTDLSSLLFSHMELVCCHNAWSRSSFIERFAGSCGTASPEVLEGTRVQNFDNVGPSGELHDMVNTLFNVLQLFLM